MTRPKPSQSSRSEAQKQQLAAARAQRRQETDASIEAGTANEEVLLQKVSEQEKELQRTKVEVEKKQKSVDTLKEKLSAEKGRYDGLHHDFRVVKRQQQRTRSGKEQALERMMNTLSINDHLQEENAGLQEQQQLLQAQNLILQHQVSGSQWLFKNCIGRMWHWRRTIRNCRRPCQIW